MPVHLLSASVPTLLSALLILWVPTVVAGAEPPALSDAQQYELSVSKGLVKFAEGKYEEAEALFRQALALRPGDPEAAGHLGQTLLRLKRYTDAEQTFSKVIAQYPSADAYLGLAIAQYYQDRFDDALSNLEQASRPAKDHALVEFYRGLTLNALGRYQEASAAFDRTMLLSPDLAPEAQYQRGLSRQALGLEDEAQAEFRAAMSMQPESEVARSAGRFLRHVRTAEPEAQKRWNIDYALSEQYDTNVVLLPLGVQPPGTGVSRKDDFRTVIYGRGEYRPIMTNLWEVGLAYGFYRSFYRELHGFEVEDHTPTVWALRRFNLGELVVQYMYDYVLVGHAPFLISHAIHPIFTIRESDRLYTQLHAQYQNKDFQHSRFASNSVRDANNYMVGFTQYLFTADQAAHVRVGYYFDTDRTGAGSVARATPGVTTGADWSYIGHRLVVGVGLPPVKTVKLDLGFEYYRQQYDNPNSFSPTGTTVRRDNIYIFNASAIKPLTKWLSLSLEYSYTRDENNLRLFDYARSIYSIMLSGRF